MSFILNIDTSTESAAVSLAENGLEIQIISNANQKDHAGFVHQAIQDIIEHCKVALTSIAAIAVVGGPGSYTGLRVGMASAKGLCYALNKPFISVGTLDIMANAVINSTNGQYEPSLYCPLIDARRMEVFTALFDGKMKVLKAPQALILDEKSFIDELKNHHICFFGSGAAKFEAVLSDKNAQFLPVNGFMRSMAELSFDLFLNNKFTDLVDSQPFYLKEFHSSPDFSSKK